MLTDLRVALRALLKTPAFTLTAVAALALGIGANTAVFGLVNQLLLNPPGMSEPERVVAVRAKYDKLALKSIGLSTRTSRTFATGVRPSRPRRWSRAAT